MRPLILISNDDGYQALGINYLIDTLRPVADILVIAPDGPRSGFSAAITTQVHMTLRTIREEEGLTVMACSGSPVDCVKMAFNVVLPRLYGVADDGYTPLRKPDLIIGGINHGDNSAVNVHYSGTMGVVIEGCMKGIPSVAFSLDTHDANADFTPMAPYIRAVVDYVLTKGIPQGSCLNINFPNTPSYQGVRICRMARGEWKEEFEKRSYPRGGDYYWLTGWFDVYEEPGCDADRAVLDEGHVAITPIRLDLTDYALKASLEKELNTIIQAEK